MTDNALAIRENLSIDDLSRVAQAMAKSGYFNDARDVAQAMVKVLAGQEMGLGAFAAMTGLHIIKGKPVLGANLIATLIKNHPAYDYRVKQLDDTGCVLVFFENGERVGESSFTAADAKKAGLGGDNWQKFPRNMYFARAISNGAKWYAPGVFAGAPVYTADELGAEVDAEGDVVEGELTTPEPTTVDDHNEALFGPDHKPENGQARTVATVIADAGWPEREALAKLNTEWPGKPEGKTLKLTTPMKPETAAAAAAWLESELAPIG